MIALLSGADWIQAIGLVGIGGVLAAIINGLFSKRKLSADATKIITDAASGTVKDLREENQRIIAQNTTQAAQITAMQKELATQRQHARLVDQVLAMHALWDRQVVEITSQHDIELPPPPPLTTGS